MKFLIIAYSDNDGVGQHAVSLNNNLNDKGYTSKILLLHKFTESKNIFCVERSIFKRLYYFLLEFIKKDFKKLFSFGNSTINYNHIRGHINKSDIIIIYTLHKILSLEMLNKIFESKKIIYLRPLDMELASGGCHVNILYNGEMCNKFELDCNNCPQLNHLNIFNLSKKIFNKKKKIIEKFKPKIFLENNFTKNLYDRSPITKKALTETIFLGVNKNRINFITKEDSRNLFNFNTDEKIILFGTFNLDAPHKGGLLIENILIKFISFLTQKNVLKKNKIKLVTFGRKNKFNINIPQIKWVHLGVINSNEKLNNLYRAADVFISPSTGCNGPHVILEALFNNLPVVGFDQGVAQDSIINSVNGYLVPCFNQDLFAESIYKALYSNKFNFENEKNRKVKNIFNSSHEAEVIAKHANNDINTNLL